MSKRYLTRPEFNAILAGLRHLQNTLEDSGHGLSAGAKEILNDGVDEPISPEEIDQLCKDINYREVQMRVEGDGYALGS